MNESDNHDEAHDPGSSMPDQDQLGVTQKEPGNTSAKEEGGRKICPACLGILQKLCNEEFVEKVNRYVV